MFHYIIKIKSSIFSLCLDPVVKPRDDRGK
ncbi:MAG TPA: palindromic element RPE4 domain-containing protein [Rickettsia endosymbiont of Bembidion nr. Transversale]|nr:palindromic element RPE4 domain-containing protein [Rickettsia endosymbiont of Bembidion nr. Transversale]